MPRTTAPLLERFCRHLPDQLPDQGCWEWQGCRSSNGYGKLTNYVDGTRLTLAAHRLSWEVHNAEPIPKGMLVMHACDNPCCVNPRHLSLGTPKANMADKVNKGRHSQGERSSRTTLTETVVREIHATAAQGQLNHSQIAEKFNVSRAVVVHIVTGKSWKHLGLQRLNGLRTSERAPRARLSNQQVQDIRLLLREGERTHQQIADQFGVSRTTISQIANNKCWNHLPAPTSKQSHSN